MNRVTMAAALIIGICMAAACPPILMFAIIYIAVGWSRNRGRKRRSVEAARRRAELRRERELILACKAMP